MEDDREPTDEEQPAEEQPADEPAPEERGLQRPDEEDDVWTNTADPDRDVGFGQLRPLFEDEDESD